jgi:hypothetical protein
MWNAEWNAEIPNSTFRIPNFLISVLSVWLVWPAITWACPLCKEILTDPGQVVQKLATAKGYAASILLMLSVPALLIGGVTLLVVRSHRRKPLG